MKFDIFYLNVAKFRWQQLRAFNFGALPAEGNIKLNFDIINLFHYHCSYIAELPNKIQGNEPLVQS